MKKNCSTCYFTIAGYDECPPLYSPPVGDCFAWCGTEAEWEKRLNSVRDEIKRRAKKRAITTR